MDKFTKDWLFQELKQKPKEDVASEVRKTESYEKIMQDIKNVKETPGWQELTKRQKGMIKTSLLSSNRAFRRTDPASSDAIANSYLDHKLMLYDEAVMVKNLPRLRNPNDKYYDIVYKHDPKTRKYRESQNLIAELNCHRAISSLELGKFDKSEPLENKYLDNLSIIEFEATIKSNNTGEVVGQKIKGIGYPCVIVFFDSRGPTHSILVLGPTESGEILCWDKADWGQPYRIESLSNELKEYHYQPHKYSRSKIGYRKLQTKLQKNPIRVD